MQIKTVTENSLSSRPRGLTDKASDFESEDCEFESRRGRSLLTFSLILSKSQDIIVSFLPFSFLSVCNAKYQLNSS